MYFSGGAKHVTHFIVGIVCGEGNNWDKLSLSRPVKTHSLNLKKINANDNKKLVWHRTWSCLRWLTLTIFQETSVTGPKNVQQPPSNKSMNRRRTNPRGKYSVISSTCCSLCHVSNACPLRHVCPSSIPSPLLSGMCSQRWRSGSLVR